LDSELKRLEVLEANGLANDVDKKRIAEIKAQMAGGVSPAPTAPSASAVPVIQQSVATQPASNSNPDDVYVIHITNPEKFKEGASYSITKEGFFRSALVNIIQPNTEKPQMWFVFETLDKAVDPVNRGVYVGEFGAGSGIFRQLLDSLKWPFTFDEATNNVTMIKMTLPVICYADWSKDTKAIGGVKISGIMTEELGAKVKVI